ncbi:methylated-DNA--[protein]-cysteine S-methyltransferase [Georgenia deserti]|uniref:Methylated-DNA--[protein]-cysteine S-methyltransferase n=1 Tax=Georgenia deserti TaxID=2093781 RepID=A0ABW4L1I8_9MICO
MTVAAATAGTAVTTATTNTITTPDGPFTVITADGSVLASGWTDDVASLLALIHPALRPGAVEPVVGATPAGDAVRAYYDGDLQAPARLAVRQRSGPYRESAWETLRQVAPGERVTYTELAARTGRPGAVRAAAGACAMNAAALFVPCHRVLRSDGALGGFRYGLPIKESLLGREHGDRR